MKNVFRFNMNRDRSPDFQTQIGLSKMLRHSYSSRTRTIRNARIFMSTLSDQIGRPYSGFRGWIYSSSM